MKITNKLGLPQALLYAVRNDRYHPGGSDITVTQLIGPPLKRTLEIEHADEIEIDVAERLWSLFGTAVHHVLEQAATDELTEQRLYWSVLGWILGGMFDNLCLTNGRISDYKMTSVFAIKDGVKPEWEQQLNVLAWLARKNNIEINKLEVVALLKDWRRAEYIRDPDEYPEVPVARLDVPLWDAFTSDTYVENRVKLHQEFPKLRCTDEERWATEPVTAVIKKGNQRATKLFKGDDRLNQAETFIAGHKNAKLLEAIERPREYRRCESYCDAAPFCPIWQEEKGK